MVIDASALVAVLAREPERELFLGAILSAESRSISVVNAFEADIVLTARGGTAMSAALDRLMADTEIEIVAVEAAHLKLVRAAWRRYGRGRHPARLNLGDCFAYALARSRQEPLLYKGQDFSQTDLAPAV